MSKRGDLDDLYSVYAADPVAGLEPLLISIHRKALAVLRDDDQAQTFTISCWQVLPALAIERSFKGWLQVRLRWHRLSAIRSARSIREEQVPELVGEDDEPLSDEEALDLLAYQHSQRQPKPEPRPDLDSIIDPTVRRAAELMLDGYTQAEAADRMMLKPATLRQRFCRYRTALLETEELPLAA